MRNSTPDSMRRPMAHASTALLDAGRWIRRMLPMDPVNFTSVCMETSAASTARSPASNACDPSNPLCAVGSPEVIMAVNDPRAFRRGWLAGLPTLLDAIRHLEGCGAEWVESVPGHEKTPDSGETVWEGEVRVFVAAPAGPLTYSCDRHRRRRSRRVQPSSVTAHAETRSRAFQAACEREQFNYFDPLRHSVA